MSKALTSKYEFEEEEGPRWWESGKYVIDPENITLQFWVQISTWIYFLSLISASLNIAFDFWFLDMLSFYECFFDIFVITDIILAFFTASEIPKHDDKRKKERNS